MGCDIHAHIEVLLHGESRWQHYSALYLNRSYSLFSRMAGVRERDGFPALVEPRGFPPDPSIITEIHYRDMGGDAHTPSWLHGWELQQIIDEFNKASHDRNEEVERRAAQLRQQGMTREDIAIRAGTVNYKSMYDEFGFLFNSGFDIRGENAGDFPDVLAAVRIVFWFDN